MVATLEGRIAASGAEQVRRKLTADWVAYDYFLRGRSQLPLPAERPSHSSPAPLNSIQAMPRPMPGGRSCSESPT